MDLWEFNCCVMAHNEKQRNEGKEQVALAWQTAAFSSAAFAGKLRKLSHYMKEEKAFRGAAISKDEFEEKLSKLKEGDSDDEKGKMSEV